MTRAEKFVKQAPLVDTVEHLQKILDTFPAVERLALYDSVRETLRPQLKTIEERKAWE